MTLANQPDFIKAIFNRCGGNGRFARVFDELDKDAKAALLDRIHLRYGEVPVLGSSETYDTWFVLTTERLLWCVRGHPHELANSQIDDVVADLRRLQASGATKMEWRELEIVSTAGERLVFEVEAGDPLIGAWNVLKRIGQSNRQRSQ